MLVVVLILVQWYLFYITQSYHLLNEAYAYFVALFSFKRSLRFMDYFTGSRSFLLLLVILP